jgi:flagella basal body P-ring formation protein FlgA
MIRSVSTLPNVRPVLPSALVRPALSLLGLWACGLAGAEPLPASAPAKSAVQASAQASALSIVAASANVDPATTATHPGATALPDNLAAEVQRLAREAAVIVWGDAATPPRIEVVLGRLDPRLKLAPCQQVLPYLPAGARPLGHTRMGLRCARGATAWNVSLPIAVKVWAPSLVASTVLPAGTVLEARHLVSAEVDLAERADPAIAMPEAALGRTLARGLAAGEALRRTDLKTRLWFSAGDTVRIVAVGPGYAISSEGQAMGPGLEGQSARVRTESGRIVSGVAAGERRVEVAL